MSNSQYEAAKTELLLCTQAMQENKSGNRTRIQKGTGSGGEHSVDTLNDE
jgi:hypothetical protein